MTYELPSGAAPKTRIGATYGGGSSSGGGFDYGAFSKKNPKTAGFLDAFMQARGMKGGDMSMNQGGDRPGDAKLLGGMGGSMSQLASGLTEQRDPFYMMKTGGKFIPGKKGIGERLAGAAVGFAKGAITGQPHMAGLGAVTGFMG